MAPSSELAQELKDQYREEALDRLRYWKLFPKRWEDMEDFAWSLAGDAHNRGDGLTLLNFNEREQQFYLTKGFKAWVIELQASLNVQQKPVAVLPLFAGKLE